MTPNELQMLLCGIGIGAEGMAVWDMLRDRRAARRDRATSQTVSKQAAADLFLNTFYAYRWTNRSHG